MKGFLLLVIVLLTTSSVYANQEKNDPLLFEKLFADWTKAFNNKDIVNSCDLFSKSVIANYRGIPPKDYVAICDGFKKIFKEKNRKYRYRFTLHEIYQSFNLAAIRITWYLTVTEKNKPTMVSQDEGMDVLQKNKDGRWKIVNYLAYEK